MVFSMTSDSFLAGTKMLMKGRDLPSRWAVSRRSSTRKTHLRFQYFLPLYAFQTKNLPKRMKNIRYTEKAIRYKIWAVVTASGPPFSLTAGVLSPKVVLRLYAASIRTEKPSRASEL